MIVMQFKASEVGFGSQRLSERGCEEGCLRVSGQKNNIKSMASVRIAVLEEKRMGGERRLPGFFTIILTHSAMAYTPRTQREVARHTAIRHRLCCSRPSSSNRPPSRFRDLVYVAGKDVAFLVI